MKILAILGTRPNFIKHYAFQRACENNGVTCVSAHTGQHFDANMSDVFFQELRLAPPEYNNDCEKTTPSGELSQLMTFIERVIYQEQPTVTLVYGDVNSTMAGALASAKLGVPVAHVEAGVRTPNIYNPEELNRRVAEVCAHTLFAHIEDAYQALLNSGCPQENIVLAGDIVKDSLLLAMKENGIGRSNQGYAAVTVHRAENTDHPERLTAICEELMDSSREIRFPVHPRTRNALDKHGLWRRLSQCGHIELMEPQSFVNNVRLLAAADRVLSDSGGVRREAYILGKPVVSLTEMIWVPSMVAAGWELVAGVDREKIRFGLDGFTPPKERPDIFGDGMAADRMVRFLLERYGDENQRHPPLTGLGNASSLVSQAMKRHAEKYPDIPRAKTLRTLVSVVICCYNEEDSLPTLFYRLEHLRRLLAPELYRLEIVLVDDRSTDSTWEMLQSKFGSDTSVRLVQNEKNLGYGGALKAGLSAVSGEVVVTIDADTDYDIAETPRLLEHMSEDMDLVTMSPFMSGGNWNYPAHRFIFSRGVVMLYRMALKGKARAIMTFTCGFRAYRANILENILPDADDFLANAEIISRALLTDLTVDQIPATIYGRKHGYSKLKTIPTIISHLGFIWKLWRGKIKPRSNS